MQNRYADNKSADGKIMKEGQGKHIYGFSENTIIYPAGYYRIDGGRVLHDSVHRKPVACLLV